MNLLAWAVSGESAGLGGESETELDLNFDLDLNLDLNLGQMRIRRSTTELQHSGRPR